MRAALIGLLIFAGCRPASSSEPQAPRPASIAASVAGDPDDNATKESPATTDEPPPATLSPIEHARDKANHLWLKRPIQPDLERLRRAGSPSHAAPDYDESIKAYRDFLATRDPSDRLYSEKLDQLAQIAAQAAEHFRFVATRTTGDKQQAALSSADRFAKIAIETFSRFIDEDALVNYPLRDHVLYELGRVLASSGDHDSARESYDRLLVEHPDSTLARLATLRKADSHFAIEDVDSARALYDGFMKDRGTPERSYALYMLGWSALLPGHNVPPRPREARKRWLEVIETYPKTGGHKGFVNNTYAAALLSLPRAQIHIDDVNAALELFTRLSRAKDFEPSTHMHMRSRQNELLIYGLLVYERYEDAFAVFDALEAANSINCWSGLWRMVTATCAGDDQELADTRARLDDWVSHNEDRVASHKSDCREYLDEVEALTSSP